VTVNRAKHHSKASSASRVGCLGVWRSPCCSSRCLLCRCVGSDDLCELRRNRPSLKQLRSRPLWSRVQASLVVRVAIG
jgi:hypothetical protein